ncbi:MAG: DUF1854 domain-containing protein [Clostridia bacterium]|jgi:hypothetical protein|nr:DUF1854 domain-containing protein [Clostridia bacterium]MBQ3870797.1 DUF1854 domain-containing protein [Clostridia bacterium]
MSDRIYINADEAKITYKGFCKVDLEMYDGRKFEDLEPRRLFPLSGLTKYITLLSPEMKEVALIRDIGQLMPESRQAVEKCLDEYYMIPKITAILDRKEKNGLLKYTVMTNYGQRSFDIRNRHSDIKNLYDGRVLFRDSNDNRYEIPDITKLDRTSFLKINIDL